MDNITNASRTPLEIVAIKSATFIVIAIAAVIGNVLVIIVISQNRSTQTITNYLIINLAVFDIMNELVNLPPYILNIIADRQYYDDIGCSIHPYIGGVLFVGSIHNLMRIAIVRYCDIYQSRDSKF
ncbi:Orexin receptor type 2 [Trichoplax sp. H2]|nr:Orexin receptor type 2 [Trichoplax sp. H2]|eukprot:RDD43464.1 Orexin receptor type 2 [Trichoplax sp. H2]